MRLIVKDRYEDLCNAAARYIAERITDFVSKNGRCVLALPTGSTPLGVYRVLVALHQAGKLSFKNGITFNMDEDATVELKVGTVRYFKDIEARD